MQGWRPRAANRCRQQVGDLQGDVFAVGTQAAKMGHILVEEGGIEGSPPDVHQLLAARRRSQTMPLRRSIVPRTVTSSR